MNTPKGSPRTVGQALVDRLPTYDKTFKRKPRSGRPRKQDAVHKQFWVK